MQIHFKQAEIYEALYKYIVNKGIDLTYKVVTISFTAGRKETGISAEVNIEDADLPDLGPDDTAEDRLASFLVLGREYTASATADEIVVKEDVAAGLAAPVEEGETAPVSTKSTSLFN